MTNTDMTKVEVAELRMDLKNFKETQETQHSDIKSDIKDVKLDIKTIGAKIDAAMACKADKSEVEAAQDKIDSINAGLLSQARSSVTQTIGIVVTAAGVIVTLLIALKK